MKKLISILAIFSTLFCCSVMSCSFAAEEVTQETVITKQEPAIVKQEKKDKTIQNVILGSLVAAYAGLGACTIKIIGSLAYEKGYTIGQTRTWYNKIWSNPIVSTIESMIRYYAIQWVAKKVIGYFCPAVSPLASLLQILGATSTERAKNLGFDTTDINGQTVVKVP